MNLNIDYLLQNLSENENEILEKIHNDPMLSKRQCPETGLFIANASKGLFTPESEHQLYAKGIVYEIKNYWEYHDGTFRDSNGLPFEYKLVALGYLKIYNFDENQIARAHVNEMIGLGAEPVYLNKLDGTFIGRFVYKDKVYIYTRGMIETMAENDEQRQYFKRARDIIKEKYPQADNPNFLSSGTALFELIGPENQIVTHYPKWDLIMTGFVVHLNRKMEFEDILADEIYSTLGWRKYRYYAHSDLVDYCKSFNFAEPVTKLYAFGETIEEQIQSINQLFSNTDDEGSVIQFEIDDPDLAGRKLVVGRIKAKTDTYRKLLKLMNNCNYDSIAAMIDKEPERFHKWETFETYLKSLGSANYPEELLSSYENLHKEYWEHYKRCLQFRTAIQFYVDAILAHNKTKIKFDYDESDDFRPILKGKDSRANFAFEVKKHQFPGACFSWIDGKLTIEYIRGTLLKTPDESKKALEKLGYEI